MTEQILYDLIVHEEWKQEPQILNEVEKYFWQHHGSLLTKLWKLSQGSVSYMLKVLRTQFRYQRSFGCPPYHFINLINNSLPWNLVLARDGKFVAILQDANIEIRSSDNISTVVANCKVDEDVLPQWQRLAWNDDRYILAYANSFGDVYLFDLTGTQICVIRKVRNSGLNIPGTLSQAVAFLHFTESDDDSWNSILYVASYQGYLKCYYISEDGSYKEKCSFSFTSYHPYGVSSIVYNAKNNLLVVAGNYGKEPFLSKEDSCYGSHCAMSVWRLLADYPFFTLVQDRGKALKKISGKDLLKNFMSIRKKQDDESLKHGVYVIRMSPDSTSLVSLHMDGRISLWHFPSMKLQNTWHKSEQPGFQAFNFESKGVSGNM